MLLFKKVELWFIFLQGYFLNVHLMTLVACNLVSKVHSVTCWVGDLFTYFYCTTWRFLFEICDMSFCKGLFSKIQSKTSIIWPSVEPQLSEPNERHTIGMDRRVVRIVEGTRNAPSMSYQVGNNWKKDHFHASNIDVGGHWCSSLIYWYNITNLLILASLFHFYGYFHFI